MGKLKYFLVATNLITLIAVAYILLSNNQSKSAYFISATVYNEFEYKKELELDLEMRQTQLQVQLDSMENELKLTIEFLKQGSPTSDQLVDLQIKQNRYIDFRDDVESKYAQTVEEYYGLIWDRINTYVSEYGEENSYQYIFGANGDGSIMYADSGSDITTDVIQYINQRYEGE